MRQIAAIMDRSPSTISRELKRNGSRTKGYKPVYADERAKARRWGGSRLERDEELRGIVLGGLKAGLSPEEVCGRLEFEEGRKVISHESIYRFIYGQMGRTNQGGWRQYLPRAKYKRGRRGRRGGSPASFIAQRRPLSERSERALDRVEPGHWEADLMLFGNRGESLLTMQERRSRLLLALPMWTKGSKAVAEAMVEMLSIAPPEWRRTVVFDNGTEFALHYELHRLGVETFFCDVRSPWQKGGVENAIGRLRRYLPRKTNLREVTRERLVSIIQRCNNTPRKCLGYRTPAEIFQEEALHFKCESTFRLPPE